ncbi:MAG TPA: DUF6364 family protein [Gemmatimonadaceae bacterium]
MGQSRKHTRRKARKSARGSTRSRRRARNLSLTAEAIERGESYSAARGTTLSAVVEEFLRLLPVPAAAPVDTLDPQERHRREIEEVRARTTSPTVRAFLGLLADSDLGDADPRELYREHLWQKYGKH